MHTCVCMCVCMCVCEKERERESECVYVCVTIQTLSGWRPWRKLMEMRVWQRNFLDEYVCTCGCMCVCVCVCECVCVCVCSIVCDAGMRTRSGKHVCFERGDTTHGVCV